MLDKEEIKTLLNARDILLKEERDLYHNVEEAMKNYVVTAPKGNDKDTHDAHRLLHAHAIHYILFTLDVLNHPIVCSADLAWTNGKQVPIACGVINPEVWHGPDDVPYRYVSVQGNNPRFWTNLAQLTATTILTLVNACSKAFDEEYKDGAQQEVEKKAECNVDTKESVNASYLREHLHNDGQWVRIFYGGPLPCPENADEITAHKGASSERPYYIDMIDDPEAEHGKQIDFRSFANLVAWLNAHDYTIIDGEQETNQPNTEE